MKRITHAIKLLTLSLLFVTYNHSYAQEGFSCDDLIGLSDATIEVRDALIELGTINQGDEVDEALGDLIEQLLDVADLEGNSALENQVNIMADGWEEMNGDKLMGGLNGSINSLETLLGNDC